MKYILSSILAASVASSDQYAPQHAYNQSHAAPKGPIKAATSGFGPSKALYGGGYQGHNIAHGQGYLARHGYHNHGHQ